VVRRVVDPKLEEKKKEGGDERALGMASVIARTYKGQTVKPMNKQGQGGNKTWRKEKLQAKNYGKKNIAS